jgi:hypothetical protein
MASLNHQAGGELDPHIGRALPTHVSFQTFQQTFQANEALKKQSGPGLPRSPGP